MKRIGPNTDAWGTHKQCPNMTICTHISSQTIVCYLDNLLASSKQSPWYHAIPVYLFICQDWLYQIFFEINKYPSCILLLQIWIFIDCQFVNCIYFWICSVCQQRDFLRFWKLEEAEKQVKWCSSPVFYSGMTLVIFIFLGKAPVWSVNYVSGLVILLMCVFFSSTAVWNIESGLFSMKSPFFHFSSYVSEKRIIPVFIGHFLSNCINVFAVLILLYQYHYQLALNMPQNEINTKSVINYAV